MAPASALPAALLCRAEALLLAGTGATRVDAFLINCWFNKLFHFSPPPGHEGGEATNGGRTQKPVAPPLPFPTFETRAVCEIGQGLAGKAALTGRTLLVRDCSRHALCEQNTGSLFCLPVLDRSSSSSAAAAGGGGDGSRPGCEGRTAILEMDTHVVDDGAAAETGGVTEDTLPGDTDVLAVLQVYCAEGELRPAAMALLRDMGRLLVPLLSGALAKREEQVQRCTAEALYSLSQIVPRDVGLLAMVEEVVLAAEHLSGSERVCLFFVDDVTNELWVAKSQDFDDAKIKLGQGLCGHAAATGEAVNVIDSYEDSRFDCSWDKQTGFVTKRSASAVEVSVFLCALLAALVTVMMRYGRKQCFFLHLVVSRHLLCVVSCAKSRCWTRSVRVFFAICADSHKRSLDSSHAVGSHEDGLAGTYYPSMAWRLHQTHWPHADVSNAYHFHIGAPS